MAHEFIAFFNNWDLKAEDEQLFIDKTHEFLNLLDKTRGIDIRRKLIESHYLFMDRNFLIYKDFPKFKSKNFSYVLFKKIKEHQQNDLNLDFFHHNWRYLEEIPVHSKY